MVFISSYLDRYIVYRFNFLKRKEILYLSGSSNFFKFFYVLKYFRNNKNCINNNILCKYIEN